MTFPLDPNGPLTEQERHAARTAARELLTAARSLVYRASLILDGVNDPAAGEVRRLTDLISRQIAATYVGESQVFACRR